MRIEGRGQRAEGRGEVKVYRVQSRRAINNHGIVAMIMQRIAAGDVL